MRFCKTKAAASICSSLLLLWHSAFSPSEQNPHLKPPSAPGARGRMLAAAMGQAKHGTAIRAFPIHRGAAFLDPPPLQAEKALDRIPDLQKAVIFRPTAGNVPRKHAKKHIAEAQPCQGGQGPESREHPHDPQKNPQRIQRVIQGIHAVAAVHKRDQFIFPVSHFLPVSHCLCLL